MLGSVRHDTQNVYVNDRHIEGAVTHAASFSIDKTPVMIAGTGFAGTAISNVPSIAFSVERSIVASEDYLTGLFNSDINSTFKYGERNSPQKTFSVNRGRITAYSLSCSVGSVASSNFSIIGLGRAGGGVDYNLSPSTPSYDISVAKAGDLSVNVSGWESNRVQSIEYSIEIPRNQRYFVGGKRFIDSAHERYVLDEIQYPITLECSFDVEVDDYEAEDVIDMICQPVEQNLNFTFNECGENEIRKFHAPNAELVDYSHSAGVGERLSLSLVYRSQINDVNDLAAIVSTTI